MKMGIVIFLSFLALFVSAALATGGRSIRWFFKPEHTLTKWVMRVYKIIGIISIILLILKI